MFDLSNCRSECTECIKAYTKKHNLKKGDTFQIPCVGIPQKYVPDSILLHTEENPENLEAMVDPVTWAKKFLDWHCIDLDGAIWKRKWEERTLGELPAYNEFQAKAGRSIFHRPYQALMLRCSSKRRVYRCGRQIGKSETLVIAVLFALFTNENFRVVLIAPYQSQVDIVFRRIIMMIKSNPLLWNSVARNIKAPTYTLELKNGSTILGFSCVAGTKIVVKDGYKHIEDICEGDEVLALDTEDNTLHYQIVTQVYTPNYKDVYKVVLMNRYEVTVSNDHPFWVKLPKTKPWRKNQYVWKQLKDLRPGERIQVGCVNDYKYQQNYQLDALGYLLGLILGNGNITETTFAPAGARFTNSNPVIQQAFEKALTDLGIPWRDQIHAVTGSKEYTIYKRQSEEGKRAQDRPYTIVSELLYKHGLVGTKSPTKFIPEELLKNDNPSFRYSLLLGLLETDGWLEKGGVAGIGSTSKKLAYQYSDLLLSFGIKNRIRLKPQKGKRALLRKPKGKQRYICSKHDMYEVTIVSKTYVRKLLNIFNLQHKENYQECWQAVQRRGRPETDISFSKIRSIEYIGEATTYDIQVGDGNNSFIANNIILHNTAGTRSGGNADSARGQTANMLLFDEADYLSPGDIDSALSIVTNFPDATVWMSSTPTGKREAFFQTCRSRLFREFHFTSYVNPNWTDELDALFRDRLTEDGYKHEILSEFGEQEEGVYQNKYIEAAQADYKYTDMKPIPGWLYSLGVDWNDKKIGVSLAVVGYSNQDHLFYVVDKKVVSHSEYTQLKACETVAEYNRLWAPFAIYIDAGFGKTQWEILRKFGYDALRSDGHVSPDARFTEILKAIEFGGMIDTYDLFTKEPIRKPTKPFLVENSVRRFEQQVVRYPISDEQYTKALQGYIVKRMSAAGVPIYEEQSSIGDHFLDAVNLALLAFTLERTEMGSPKFLTDIAFAPRFQLRGENRLPPEPGREPSIRPPGDRVGILDPGKRPLVPSSENRLPAMNTNTAVTNNWLWDGFLRDEPRPTGMTMMRKPRIQPPRRKKI